MDCSKSDPNSSLYKGGKWARTMSGYIALKAVSFSVCLLHNARSVDTLHINCGERGDRLFRFTGRQGHGAMVVKNIAPYSVFTHIQGQTDLEILRQVLRHEENLTLIVKYGTID